MQNTYAVVSYMLHGGGSKIPDVLFSFALIPPTIRNMSYRDHQFSGSPQPTLSDLPNFVTREKL